MAGNQRHSNRRRLVRWVVALYPGDIRDRYGAEIAEMLLHSPRPGRDLVDVAWHAITDRAATLPAALTSRHAAIRAVRVAGLLAAPLGFGIALGILAGAAVAVIAVLEGFGYRIGYRLTDAAVAVSVIPVLLGTVWLGRRTGRRASATTPAPVVPTAVALGAVAAASLPYLGEALGETWWATELALLCWYAAMLGLAAGGAALVRRANNVRRASNARRPSSRGAAFLVVAVGGLVVVEFACTVNAMLVHGRYGVPLSAAFGAYFVRLIGIDPAFAGDPAGQLADALKGLPALLTVCTMFSLTSVITVARRRSLS